MQRGLFAVNELNADEFFITVPGLTNLITILDVISNDDGSWTVDTVLGTLTVPSGDRKIWAVKKG